MTTCPKDQESPWKKDEKLSEIYCHKS
ncbi:hypothetical protein NHJ13734_002113 [Beauveria thailandica]